MKDVLLITPNIGLAVATMADAARVGRDELLNQAAMVTTVADRIDADDALAVLKSLKDFATMIELQRKAAKEPALELSRKIDGLAKELVERVNFEATRISRVLGTYEAEERRKADDARRAAEAEAARIAAEAARESLAARRAAPTELAAAKASDAIVEKAQEQIVAVRQQATNLAAPKAAGTRLAGTVAFEVTDIKALYAAHPELCVVEPNGTAIRAILRQNPNLQVPGLRHWIDHKISV